MTDFAAELFAPGVGDSVEFDANDDLIIKEIMRTGEWSKTPSSKGVVRKPLKVVRDGQSSAQDRVISLSELVEAFNDKAFQYVTIPLSDDPKDHKNLTKLNTGFVKRLFIEDLPNGVSKLKAAMHFTEPEVREKVTRGTYPDVSAGVYFDVETPAGKKFNSAINHVCLTIKPFIDGLNPFGVLASDEEEAPREVEGFVPPVAVIDPPAPEAGETQESETPQAEVEEPAEPVEPEPLVFKETASLSWRQLRVSQALTEQLKLDDEKYEVADIGSDVAIVKNKVSGASWIAPYTLSGDGVIVAQVSEWQIHENPAAGSQQPEVPSAAPTDQGEEEESSNPQFSDLDPITRARKLRELRLRGTDNSEGGEVMGRNNDPLEGIDLSNEEAIKEVVAKLASDNQSLRSRSRESEVGSRIEELKGMGFSEEPGFLRNVRDILLSDDEAPAVVLLERDEEGKETGTKAELTATEIVDRLVSSLRKDDEGKVMLSQQHLVSGDETPPPARDEGAEEDVETRTAGAAEAIGVELSTSDNGKEA